MTNDDVEAHCLPKHELGPSPGQGAPAGSPGSTSAGLNTAAMVATTGTAAAAAIASAAAAGQQTLVCKADTTAFKACLLARVCAAESVLQAFA